MRASEKEPTFQFSFQDVADKSDIAKNFLSERDALNVNVDKAANSLLKRFYNIDHNTYLNGELPALEKELQGLAVSAGLRCDDCIFYHVIQGFRLGATRKAIEETLNVALIVGGSIVIPHMRRAYALLSELYA